jgi:hypothetical protein
LKALEKFINYGISKANSLQNPLIQVLSRDDGLIEALSSLVHSEREVSPILRTTAQKILQILKQARTDELGSEMDMPSTLSAQDSGFKI